MRVLDTIKQPIEHVDVNCMVSRERDRVKFLIETLDGAPLTPQILIDAIGDYLLIDPHGLFTHQG